MDRMDAMDGMDHGRDGDGRPRCRPYRVEALAAPLGRTAEGEHWARSGTIGIDGVTEYRQGDRCGGACVVAAAA